MKITFPHMGNVYIAAKGLLEEIGREVVLPPPITKKTLELGTKYTPESICLPLKINIGNYIESIEKGADTILITGSCGPCRFGFYGSMEKRILKDLGYDVEFISFDPPEGNPNALLTEILKAAGTKNIFKIMKAVSRGKQVLYSADNLLDYSNYKRAVAINKNKVDQIMDEFYFKIEGTKGVNEINSLISSSYDKLKILKEDNKIDNLKIGIIGEIYTIIEPFVNLNIEKKLGHMGVIVEKSLTPSKWVSHHIGLGQIGISEERKKWKKAKPYLPTLVGGHGRETVGSAILYAEENFDGLIQILPFNCMPEIVAESVLPSVQKDYNIPIMTLIVDEMTGEAGYLTRIEAFIDLVRKRKESENERIICRS
ncbi:CoA protein activase [Clostridium sp. D2Q-11]|uniref:CoA protein activase n=1 Tax=Anaeromonas frigoriresistens TaxID=2683708 RepID=A0A942UYW1_9FIRM|nr:acyl-CoA dehydratase activase-related protein [Anaeromonas frigoriresistens]MBS4540160.1 CoA protein activase [Anaeromonas frigoriresistens]